MSFLDRLLRSRPYHHVMMKVYGAVLVVAALLMLSACASASTTTSQAASAITKTQEELQSDLDYFKTDACQKVYVMRDKQNEKQKCDDALKRVREHAKIMKSDLESLRPWSSEIAELAGKTVDDLGQLVLATEDTSNQRGSRTAAAGSIIGSNVRAWKAFGT